MALETFLMSEKNEPSFAGKYFKKTKNTTQLTKARTTTRLDKIAV